MAHLQNTNEMGVALQEYDPVSYFSHAAVPGNPEISSTVDGATYYFSSAANKATFDQSPQQYTPQYGGFCAVAVSEGKTFPIDPTSYTVTDNKLYLFYNGKLGNTKPQWEADATTRQANADQHWQNNDLAVVYPTVDY
ncbi:YHS domain-containing protein [filamentous cyanobacterium LEGE 11480]|uniref:YHS domain-containing protein n=1 Tax=Romeriopsis navalis LEGE 11480 TaxID=2777977 RepID=A0A928VKJ9_9CYAN|nr:YHS domain-containing (seleno)protein [Romeriopsis navalis]MBE9028240.1 YHS domain-containing protein [Romeriopsis navalis LEGE 11480]